MHSAKDKLNGVAVRVSIFVGFMITLIFQSMACGFIAAAGTLVASMISGDYRLPSKPKQLRRKR